MPTITTAKPAELVTQVIIDNSAGGAFDYSLIIFDSATDVVTLGDGSQNDVTRWIRDRLLTVYNNAPAAQISFTAACRAILNIQNLAPGGAQLAQVVTLVGSVFTFKLTIPAGYNSAFLWGATQSIEGGFALSGSFPAGSGGGGVTNVTASAPLASSGGATPNLSVTGQMSLAQGGTSTNLSGSAANQGAFFYGGSAGSASLMPLPVVVNPISTNPSPATTAKANPITINLEVKNGSVFFDLPTNVLVAGQLIAAGGAVALTDLSLTSTVGSVFLAPDFTTSGQFFVETAGFGPNSGKATFTVNTLAVNPAGVAGSLFLLLGPGPGCDVVMGARTNLTFT